MIKNYIGLWLGICLLITNTTLVYATHPKETKEKTITANYPVSEGALLELDNRYGHVKITNHDRQEVAVKVLLKAWAGTAQQAEQLLQSLEVKHQKTAKGVALRTIITTNDKNTQNISSSRGFQINYEIKLPKHMRLELDNAYGNVSLEDMLGAIAIQIKHGHLKARQLGESKINLVFGHINIEGVQGKSTIDNKHGHVNIQQADDLTIEVAHGNINLGQINWLEGKLKHGHLMVERIDEGMVWENQFGHVVVKQIEAAFEEVEIDVQHGHTTIGVNAQASYQLDAATQYGNISQQLPNITTQKGHLGQFIQGSVNGGGKKRINIEVEHGNVVIKKT